MPIPHKEWAFLMEDVMGFFDFFKKKRNKTNLTVLDTVPMVKRPEIKFEAIDINENSILSIKHSFVSVDFETTGLDRVNDRIIKISAVSFENGEKCRIFSSLVKSNGTVQNKSQSLNHISDSTIANAPDEKTVFSDFLDFLKSEQEGEIKICAYNGDFEFEFLQHALIRLGIEIKIKTINTLPLCQKYISSTENHKQSSVEEYFGLKRENGDKSISDAENCGLILLKLLDIAQNKIQKENKYIEESKPTEHELEVCAYIQNLLVEHNADLSAVRYRRDRSGYVLICCYHTFLKFKIGKKGQYLLVESNCGLIKGYYTNSCTESEGGQKYTRVYFTCLDELKGLSDYIYSSYCNAYENMCSDLTFSDYRKNSIEKYKKDFYSLSNERAKNIVESARMTTYPSICIPEVKKITRDDVFIDAKNNRRDFSEIKSHGGGKEFGKGMDYWAMGENVRKNGKIEEAIQMFDMARECGYDAPALYESYAIAYRKLKDYSNEIVILDEAITFYPERSDKWIARRERAIELLYKQQEGKRDT